MFKSPRKNINISHDLKFIYFSIQKNASTSMLNIINNISNDIEIVDNIDLTNFKEYYKFTLFRNPYNRTRSLLQMYLKKLHCVSEKDIVESINTDSSVDNLNEVEEKLAKIGEKHWFKQILYFPKDDMDLIGTLENIDYFLEEISKNINIDMKKYIKCLNKCRINRFNKNLTKVEYLTNSKFSEDLDFYKKYIWYKSFYTI